MWSWRACSTARPTNGQRAERGVWSAAVVGRRRFSRSHPTTTPAYHLSLRRLVVSTALRGAASCSTLSRGATTHGTTPARSLSPPFIQRSEAAEHLPNAMRDFALGAFLLPVPPLQWTQLQKDVGRPHRAMFRAWQLPVRQHESQRVAVCLCLLPLASAALTRNMYLGRTTCRVQSTIVPCMFWSLQGPCSGVITHHFPEPLAIGRVGGQRGQGTFCFVCL